MSAEENLGPQFRKGDIVEHSNKLTGRVKRIKLDQDSRPGASPGRTKITGNLVVRKTNAVTQRFDVAYGYSSEMRRIES